MPITQDRMLSLLIEHERHIEAHRQLRRNIERVLEGHKGELLAQDIRAELYAFETVPTTRAQFERAHFNRFGRYNLRQREKQTARRRAQGIEPREPFTLDEIYDTPRYDDLAEAAQYISPQRTTQPQCANIGPAPEAYDVQLDDNALFQLGFQRASNGAPREALGDNEAMLRGFDAFHKMQKQDQRVARITLD